MPYKTAEDKNTSNRRWRAANPEKVRVTARRNRKGQRYPYRLSTDPADYTWETQAENNARRCARRDASEPPDVPQEEE